MNLRARLRDPSLLVEGAYVGREWIAATSGAEITVVDPAETIATVPALGGRETRDAIRAAEVAWPAWKALPAAERARRLELWHDLMLANLEDLAVIMTMEQGKPLAEARGEIRYGASFVKWFAEDARRVYGDVIPAPDHGRRTVVLKEPVGVSAANTLWNFPNRHDHPQVRPGARRRLPEWSSPPSSRRFPPSPSRGSPSVPASRLASSTC
ncbi:MAG: succinate-semialdehyde dehydrogenase [Geminicoccaceae bacterium]|nr:succinate-semialdehyde dehydrogenase [Geminicoccaceae bacterium]